MDETRTYISKVLCNHRFTLNRAVDGLDTQHQHAKFGHLSLNYLRYGDGVSVDVQELGDFFLFEALLSGRSTVRHGHEEAEASAASGFILSPDRPLAIRWTPDCSKMIIKIDREVIESHLAAMLDCPLFGPLRFDITMPFTTGAGQSLRRMVDYVFADAAVEDAAASPPLVRRQLEMSFLTALLLAQRHNHSDLLHRAASPAAPRYVRRAEEIMRAHAGQPLTLLDITIKTGVSARTLQAGFKRFRDQTPMAYLREYRLLQVKADLERARHGETVSNIAARWGFNDMSSFAALYRKRFGQRPSETLAFS